MNIEQKQAVTKLSLLLQLNRKAVGVKFAKTKFDYDKEPARELVRAMPYCVAVQCATKGYSIKLDKTTSGCPGSSRAFALIEPGEDYYSGTNGYRLGLYKNKTIACDIASKFSILKEPNYGIIIKPLEAWETEPDCVLIIGNSYCVMRIIQGYTYQFGMLPKFNITGNQGICIECTSYPYNEFILNASFLCSGTRYQAGWLDEEAGVGMPFSMFSAVVEGIANTANRTEPDNKKDIITASLKQYGMDEKLIHGEAYYL